MSLVSEISDVIASIRDKFNKVNTRKATTVSYAASITPNPTTTDILNVGTLTGNITILAPGTTAEDGQNLLMRFTQDATGGRVVTFTTGSSGAFEYAYGMSSSMLPTAASVSYSVLAKWVASASRWRIVAISSIAASDERPSDFPTLGPGALSFDDFHTLIDTSDTTDNASGSDKKMSPLVVTRRLGTQHLTANATGTKVTDLDLPLPVGTYTFTYACIVQSAATGVGVFLGVNFTGTGTPYMHFRFADATTSLAAEVHIMDNVGVTGFGFISGMAQNAESTTAPNMGTTVGVAAANANILCFVEGILVVTGAGTLELWHGSEAAGNTSVEVGSTLVAIRSA